MPPHLKGVMRGLKNSFMKFEDCEVRVREATSSDSWGASSTLLSQIAQDSFDRDQYRLVFSMLWRRLNDLAHIQHVMKALVLVEYLIRHGVPRFVKDVRDHVRAVSRLKRYKYTTDGVEIGREVRAKAAAVFDLVMSDEAVEQARSTAASTRARLVGFGANSPRQAVHSPMGIGSQSFGWHNPGVTTGQTDASAGRGRGAQAAAGIERRAMTPGPRASSRRHGDPASSSSSGATSASASLKKRSQTPSAGRRKSKKSKKSKKGSLAAMALKNSSSIAAPRAASSSRRGSASLPVAAAPAAASAVPNAAFDDFGDPFAASAPSSGSGATAQDLAKLTAGGGRAAAGAAGAGAAAAGRPAALDFLTGAATAAAGAAPASPRSGEHALDLGPMDVDLDAYLDDFQATGGQDGFDPRSMFDDDSELVDLDALSGSGRTPRPASRAGSNAAADSPKGGAKALSMAQQRKQEQESQALAASVLEGLQAGGPLDVSGAADPRRRTSSVGAAAAGGPVDEYGFSVTASKKRGSVLLDQLAGGGVVPAIAARDPFSALSGVAKRPSASAAQDKGRSMSGQRQEQQADPFAFGDAAW